MGKISKPKSIISKIPEHVFYTHFAPKLRTKNAASFSRTSKGASRIVKNVLETKKINLQIARKNIQTEMNILARKLFGYNGGYNSNSNDENFESVPTHNEKFKNGNENREYTNKAVKIKDNYIKQYRSNVHQTYNGNGNTNINLIKNLDLLKKLKIHLKGL